MRTLDRRQLTQLGFAAGVATTFGSRFAFGSALEPTPDFTVDADTRYVAGIRPFRTGSFRLEGEDLGERFLAHNYGHGGAGITMSWGVAHEVRDLVMAWIAQRDASLPKTAAVLGAGVIGLTAATLLLEAGFAVTIYAKGFLEETTSSVAGGQFSPSTVAFTEDAEGTERFRRILRRSFRTHESKLGQGFGVVRRRNYTWSRSHSFGLIPRDVVPEPEAFAPLPFVGHENRPGFSYQTLLIEPPILLRRLELDLRLAGVRMIRRTFDSLEQILATTTQSVLVNCMGLGAGTVLNDAAIVPIRGQLVLLKPQPELQYLYGGNGYIFPRSDYLLIGGSFETGVADPTPVPEHCAQILAQAKAPFYPAAVPPGPVPRWMIDETEFF